ncbi:hypothetical protein ACX3V1_00400 [Escherichia coli]
MRIFAATYANNPQTCLLYTSPSPRDISGSRMPSSACKGGAPPPPPTTNLHDYEGIRDPEMSRGLGDVYKRQYQYYCAQKLKAEMTLP